MNDDEEDGNDLILTLASPQPPKWTPRLLNFDSNESLVVNLIIWKKKNMSKSSRMIMMIT